MSLLNTSRAVGFETVARVTETSRLHRDPLPAVVAADPIGRVKRRAASIELRQAQNETGRLRIPVRARGVILTVLKVPAAILRGRGR